MKIKYLLIIFILIYLTNCSSNTDRHPSQTHTIAKGVVSDTTLGIPIDSVEIVLTKSVYVSLFDAGVDYYIGPKYTNSHGEFFIENKHNYNDDIVIYKLSVGKQGYWYQFFDIEENGVNEFDVALKPTPTELYTSASGKVLNRLTELPIDSVKVSLLRETDFTNEYEAVAVVFTDSVGEYFIEDYYTRNKTENFPDYKLLIEKKGYNSHGWGIATNFQSNFNAAYLTPE